MGGLNFDSLGRFVGMENKTVKDYSNEIYGEITKRNLRTSESLEFLKNEGEKIKNSSDREFWSLYQNGEALKPLEFSNGKTQEDIVKEIKALIDSKTRIIFLHGTCGTGKSAIALNLARAIGKASVVVPVKALQTQYEKDYTDGKYLVGSSGKKMKIAVMTGRENHDSLIKPGASCADPTLPDTIKLTEKNYAQIKEYYEENPLIQSRFPGNIKRIRRMAIAPANPYWSPIISSDYEAINLRDARRHEYQGCDGKKYVFYHRKEGCSYYDQYLAYKESDAIIFNSAKYNSEIAIGRKPLTEIDIIDEADVFLDNYFEQSELNLTLLAASLRNIYLESENAESSIREIDNLISLEEKNKQAIGIDEAEIFRIEDTRIKKIIEILGSNNELQSEILLDETNYANKALEIAENFLDSMKSRGEIYLTYRKYEGSLIVKIVSTDLSYKFRDLLGKTKALVFMSGTLHSPEVLEHIFKIKDYKVVEAETLNPGTMDITMTGKEFDCKYAGFRSGKHTREDYLVSLSVCLEKLTEPALIHVQAFQDLPSEQEKSEFNLGNIVSREELISSQKQDRLGEDIKKFKTGEISRLFSTKCSRGVDFPGNVCKSIVFTKYPNPNVKDTFWKVIQKTHSDYYWEFYRNKAEREFLQRLYRAIRSKDDHVSILSPDMRVLKQIKNLQNL